MYKAFGKRLFDVVWAVCSIILLSPFLLMVSLAILLFDPGPVLFSHQRIGRNSVPFRFYKFRSMPVDTPKVPSDRLGDVRLTIIGRFIRRTNIDELPQLFNILKGDMSVVGPRPPLLDQVELVDLRCQNGSLALRPGLTGLAQIRSFNGMSVRQKAAFDAAYAQSVSLAFDLAIIFQTVFYLFRSPPVY
jgi:O-antigen biosynthesis protein WbqP